MSAKYSNIQIDPRYRDSRPIVHNSSSSFEINWDSNPQIFVEEYCEEAAKQKPQQSVPVRRASPTPSIVVTSSVEEEDEEEQREQEEVEDVFVRPTPPPPDAEVSFDGVEIDDIPFIDEDNSPPPSTYIPPKMKDLTRTTTAGCGVGGGGGIMMDKTRRTGNLGGRKTVSFDTINRGRTSTASNFGQDGGPLAVPKSKTYEYVIDVEIERNNGGGSISSNKGTKTNVNNEPIFKLNDSFSCSSNLPSISKKTLNKNNEIDKISIYFTDGMTTTTTTKTATGNGLRAPMAGRENLDMSEIALDLTALNSDSTTGSSSSGGVTRLVVTTDEPDKIFFPHLNNINKRLGLVEPPLKLERETAYKISWPKQKSVDDVRFCTGKVKALTKYFNTFENLQKTMSLSSPDLQIRLNQIDQLNHQTENNDNGTRLNNSGETPRSNRLSQMEREDIMRQLKEWSTYGTTYDKSEKKNFCYAAGHQPNELRQIYNKIDDTSATKSSSSLCKSTPNLAEFILNENCYELGKNNVEVKKKFPDAYIIKKKPKKKGCRADCSVHDRPIKISNLAYSMAATNDMINKTISCPDLYEPIDEANIFGGFRNDCGDLPPHTPVHQSSYLTLKQIKNNRVARSRCAMRAAAGSGTSSDKESGRFYTKQQHRGEWDVEFRD